MKNHLYIFDSEVYKQSRGGPIGLELTGVIADLVMIWFDKHFIKAAEEAGINIVLFKRYVDDVNLAVKLTTDFYKESETETEMEGRLAEWLKQIADSILPEVVTMEVDAPTFHDNGRLPILDVEVWVEGGNKIMHSFYKKAVSSKQVVLARSALSNQSKRSILVRRGSGD